jgi:hypothetical protein
VLEIGARCAPPGDARLGQRVEFVQRAVDDLARPHPDVHQPLDGVQLGDLRRRVLPLAVVVALRLGKAVAPLPHPQDVLGEAGLALDRADVQRHRGIFQGSVHCPGHMVDKRSLSLYCRGSFYQCPGQ